MKLMQVQFVQITAEQLSLDFRWCFSFVFLLRRRERFNMRFIFIIISAYNGFILCVFICKRNQHMNSLVCLCLYIRSISFNEEKKKQIE